MNKQTLPKELQTKKQRITSADVKKQNDLKLRKCNDISTTPVKWKRKDSNISVKEQMTKMQKNLDDVIKKKKKKKNAELLAANHFASFSTLSRFSHILTISFTTMNEKINKKCLENSMMLKKKAQHAADKKRGKYANKPRQC